MKIFYGVNRAILDGTSFPCLRFSDVYYDSFVFSVEAGHEVQCDCSAISYLQELQAEHDKKYTELALKEYPDSGDWREAVRPEYGAHFYKIIDLDKRTCEYYPWTPPDYTKIDVEKTPYWEKVNIDIETLPNPIIREWGLYFSTHPFMLLCMWVSLIIAFYAFLILLVVIGGFFVEMYKVFLWFIK